MLQALDKDKDGKIQFDEYLRLYFPSATEVERGIMREWAFPTTDAPPPQVKTLSEEQREEIKASRSILPNHCAHRARSSTAMHEHHARRRRIMPSTQGIFVLYDLNGDGVLSRPELIEALTSTGYDEDEVEDMFDEFDQVGTHSFSRSTPRRLCVWMCRVCLRQGPRLELSVRSV